MGFLLKYRRFISLFFLTEEGEPVDGFSFFPTAESEKLFKRHNLIFRGRSASFDLFYGETPFLPIEQRLCFRIGIRFSESGFMQRYGLTTDTSLHSALFFGNLSSGTIQTGEESMMTTGSVAGPDDTCNLKKQSFNKIEQVEEGTTSISYVLTNSLDPGQTKTVEATLMGDEDYVVLPLNPVDQPNYFDAEGLYYLEHQGQTERIYLHDELRQKKMDGVVEIYWEASQKSVPNETGQLYKIKLKT